MYGVINTGVKALVLERFGPDAWRGICEEAGVVDDEWIQHEYYSDEQTVALAAAAAKALGVGADEVLKLYGAYFLKFLKDSAMDKILHVMGRDLPDFLSNLDYLHQHLHDTWKLASFPHFKCTRLANGDLDLDYQSTRGSLLAPFVQGLVSAVADNFFHTPVEISQTSADGMGARFRIHFVGKGGAGQPAPPQAVLVEGEMPATDLASVAADSLASAGLPITFFLSLWPFFVLTDAQMAVTAVGPALAERVPAAAPGAHFHNVFAVERPEAARDAPYAVLQEHANVAVRVVSREAVAGGRPLALRGAVHFVAGAQCLWLLAPVMLDLGDMRLARLSLKDLPLHDAGRDLLFMSQSNATQTGLLVRLERLSAELAHEQARSDELLFSMLPPSVLDDLREGRKVRGREHEAITILFSDIVGFTDMSGVYRWIPSSSALPCWIDPPRLEADLWQADLTVPVCVCTQCSAMSPGRHLQHARRAIHGLRCPQQPFRRLQSGNHRRRIYDSGGERMQWRQRRGRGACAALCTRVCLGSALLLPGRW